MKSKCRTVQKSLTLSKLSGKSLLSGTPEHETCRKCTLSKSGNLQHRVDLPTSSTLSIQKSVAKKIKISSKISEIQKLREGKGKNSENNLSGSEQNIGTICDGPMTKEITQKKCANQQR